MNYYGNNTYYNTDISHFGILGMKWGHRNSKNKNLETNKKKTNSYNKQKTNSKSKFKYKSDLIEIEGPNSKAKKQLKKYIKQSTKDINEALKNHDKSNINRLVAGRTFAKTLVSTKFRNMAVRDAGIRAGVRDGENYSYNFLRNNKTGHLDVTVNGVKSSYVYGKGVKDIDKVYNMQQLKY